MISAREYWRILRKYLVIILIAAACGGLIGYSFSQSLPRNYTSQVLLSVQVKAAPDVTAINNSANLTVASANALAAITQLDATRRDAAARAGGGQGRFSVQSKVISGTSVLDLSVTSTSPEEAARFGNAMAATLAGYGTRIAPKTKAGLQGVEVKPVAPASVPGKPDSISPVPLEIAGAVVAGLIAYVLFLLRAVSVQRVHGEDDLRGLVGQAYAGEVVGLPNAFADATQSVAARLGWVVKGDQGHAAVVGQVGHVGRHRHNHSAVIALGQAVAGLGRSVLLVEATPDRGALLSAAGVPSGAGFVQGARDPKRAAEASTSERLGVDVMPAGGTAEELLAAVRSDGAAVFLTRLLGHYDLVLFDATDRAPLSTLLALADLTKQTVVAVTRDTADVAAVRQLVEEIQPDRRPAFVSWREGASHTLSLRGIRKVDHQRG